MSAVTSSSAAPQVRRCAFTDLSLEQLYALLQLRVDVFVVEQACAYAELDGLDVQPSTDHYWVGIDSHPVATLRTVRADDGMRIGRVATAIEHRGHGFAAGLMRVAMRDLLERGDLTIRVEAQRHLHDWYAGFGFVAVGADYVEDGIAHISMAYRSGTIEHS